MGSKPNDPSPPPSTFCPLEKSNGTCCHTRLSSVTGYLTRRHLQRKEKWSPVPLHGVAGKEKAPARRQVFRGNGFCALVEACVDPMAPAVVGEKGGGLFLHVRDLELPPMASPRPVAENELRSSFARYFKRAKRNLWPLTSRTSPWRGEKQLQQVWRFHFRLMREKKTRVYKGASRYLLGRRGGLLPPDRKSPSGRRVLSLVALEANGLPLSMRLPFVGCWTTSVWRARSVSEGTNSWLTIG